MTRATNKAVIVIRNFILHQLLSNARTVIPSTIKEFGLTRQAVSRHLKALVDSGDVLARGETKSRKYALATKFSVDENIQISPVTEEYAIWTKLVRPHLADLKPNVIDICHHGFTEMMNNVIDHSTSPVARIHIRRTAVSLDMRIMDKGVGIFKKIQQDFDLDDQRHALLELSKGRLTSDADNHSGEGIFFTSRMFDKFMIHSGKMVYMCMPSNEDYLFDSLDKAFVPGTAFYMFIKLDSARDSTAIFDRFTLSDEDHAFSKTQVPVFLASYDNDQLVSRSAAKRVLVRFTKFKEVCLDFQKVERVGQAFADEIFRVYAKANPNVSLYYSNANDEVVGMIKRAINKRKEQEY